MSRQETELNDCEKKKTDNFAGNARIDLTYDLVDSASVCVEMGWALKKDKKYVRFSQNVKLS